MTLQEPPLVELLQFLVANVVSHPDRVNISRVETPKTDLFYLTVHADDLGRLLGREGKTVEAIRTMVDVAAGQFGKTAVVDVVEPRRKSSEKSAKGRRRRPRRGRRSGGGKSGPAKNTGGKSSGQKTSDAKTPSQKQSKPSNRRNSGPRKKTKPSHKKSD